MLLFYHRKSFIYIGFNWFIALRKQARSLTLKTLLKSRTSGLGDLQPIKARL